MKQRGLITVWLLWSQAHKTVSIWHSETTRVNYLVDIVITSTRNRSHFTQWNNEGKLPCSYCDHRHTKPFPFHTVRQRELTSVWLLWTQAHKPFTFDTGRQRGLTTLWILWSQAHETVYISHSETPRVNYNAVTVIRGTLNRSHFTQWNNEG